MTNNDKPLILIVEDNELNLTLVREMILREIPDTLVQEAHDGISAIQAVRQWNPNIIIMDIQMPLLDGLDATRQIRDFSNVPIIALTAGAFNEEKEKCLQAGMNDFLTKPVAAKELIDVVKKHLGIVSSDQNSTGTSEAMAQIDLHINEQSLLNNLSQDKKIMFHLFQIARNSFPKNIASLKQAFQESNFTDIKAVLHSIRGSAQNMYFTKLADQTRYLEINFQNLQPLEIENCLHDIDEEWNNLEEIMDSLAISENKQDA